MLTFKEVQIKVEGTTKRKSLAGITLARKRVKKAFIAWQKGNAVAAKKVMKDYEDPYKKLAL